MTDNSISSLLKPLIGGIQLAYTMGYWMPVGCQKVAFVKSITAINVVLH